MAQLQTDLFSTEPAANDCLSDEARQAIRHRLEAAISRLEAARAYLWNDPLDAVHEENRCERDAELLGEEGAALWARFDRAMDRLHLLQG